MRARKNVKLPLNPPHTASSTRPTVVQILPVVMRAQEARETLPGLLGLVRALPRVMLAIGHLNENVVLGCRVRLLVVAGFPRRRWLSAFVRFGRVRRNRSSGVLRRLCLAELECQRPLVRLQLSCIRALDDGGEAGRAGRKGLGPQLEAHGEIGSPLTAMGRGPLPCRSGSERDPAPSRAVRPASRSSRRRRCAAAARPNAARGCRIDRTGPISRTAATSRARGRALPRRSRL